MYWNTAQEEKVCTLQEGKEGQGCDCLHGRLSKEGEQELGRETRGVMGGRWGGGQSCSNGAQESGRSGRVRSFEGESLH